MKIDSQMIPQKVTKKKHLEAWPHKEVTNKLNQSVTQNMSPKSHQKVTFTSNHKNQLNCDKKVSPKITQYVTQK